MPFGDGTGPRGGGRGKGFGRGLGRGRGFGRRIWDVDRPVSEHHNKENLYSQDASSISKEEELENLKRKKRELEQLLRNLENEIKNKEKGNLTKKAKVVNEKCVGCGICVPACPEGAISINEIAKINQDLCTGCGNCVTTCPRNAIVMS